MRLGPHTVTVVRASSKPSDYGNTVVDDWSAATRATVTGCSVQPQPSDEYTVDRDSTQTIWAVWLPHDADVKATDRIEWDGQEYDIDGDVLVWSFGSLAHKVLNMQRSEDDEAV